MLMRIILVILCFAQFICLLVGLWLTISKIESMPLVLMFNDTKGILMVSIAIVLIEVAIVLDIRILKYVIDVMLNDS